MIKKIFVVLIGLLLVSTLFYGVVASKDEYTPLLKKEVQKVEEKSTPALYKFPITKKPITERETYVRPKANHAPTAVDDIFDFPVGEIALFDLLGNDYDIDGDRIFILRAGSGPQHGEIIGYSPLGGLQYQAHPTYVGTDSFTYIIQDEHGLQDTATVILNLIDTQLPNTNVDCGEAITQDTTLTNDIEDCTWEGLTIAANDVTLDCNGHRIFSALRTDPQPYSIMGTFVPGDGIKILNVNGVTIKNCEIFGFGVAINATNSEDVSLIDNYAYSNKFGFYMKRPVSGLLQSNNVSDNYFGLYLSDPTFVSGTSSIEINSNTICYNHVRDFACPNYLFSLFTAPGELNQIGTFNRCIRGGWPTGAYTPC